MINAEIHPDLGSPVAPELLERAARSTLEFNTVTDADLSLLLTGDARIRELNRNFLNQDSPTDVLSFPANETDPETGRVYLGDVIISLPRAREQAGIASHPLEAELQLLVVHGVLHLLGFDHASQVKKVKMWAAQAKILESLGWANIQVRED